MSQFILFFIKLVLDSFIEIIIKEHHNCNLRVFKNKLAVLLYAFNTRSLTKKNRNYFGYKHRGLISLCAGGFPPQVVELKPFKGKALKKDWTNVERTSSFLPHPKKKVFGNVFPGPCLISSWVLHLIAEDCALPFLCHSSVSWRAEQCMVMPFWGLVLLPWEHFSARDILDNEK